MTHSIAIPPRLRVIYDVLESAKDVGHVPTINACRRLIVAHIRGWKRHHDPADWAMVREVDEELRS